MALKNKITFITTLTLLSGGIVACKPDNGPTFIDYAHTQLSLTLDYKGKDFFKQGVGEFELWTCIDGDTAHFTPINKSTSSETVKARFYGIDTPESTGRIQEYGKAASNFTKEKLKHAAENGTIVLAGVSSTYGVPGQDANGRYLACVWINEEVKNAPYTSLTNLNLWIVQEGYSDVGSLDKMPEYADVFEKAYWQAKDFKLNKFSGLPDPLFNYGEYVETFIPDIAKEVQASFADPTHENPYNGEKVRVQGTVTGFANNTLFLQQYDEETKQYYGVNVFCGMTKPAAKYLKIGNRLQLCAVAQDSENFGFQLTGAEGHFPVMESAATEDDCKILVRAENNTVDPLIMGHTFEYTASQLTSKISAKNYEALNSGVVITDTLEVSKFYPNQDNNKWTIQFKNTNFGLYLTNAYAGDPSKQFETWTEESQWVGKKFKLNYGVLASHKTTSGNISFQFNLVNNSDLVWVPEE